MILLGTGTTFAANHLAARIAFDHGGSVAAGVTVRATSTVLVLLLMMMRLQRISMSIPRQLRGRAFLAGMLIATQSYRVLLGGDDLAFSRAAAAARLRAPRRSTSSPSRSSSSPGSSSATPSRRCSVSRLPYRGLDRMVGVSKR